LDTGCVVALLDQSEKNHTQCRKVVSSLPLPLFTCEAVIAESCYLERHLRGASETILENVLNGAFKIPLRLLDQASNVKKLMKKYANLEMDLADGCLVDLANHLQTGRILTLDRDFKVYRWARNRHFELLLEI
jgi:predicted nucleic acid-binding protein